MSWRKGINMSNGISYETACEKCESKIEVMLYEGDDGDPDIESSTCCPPSDSSCDPSECPECGHPILICDIDEISVDHHVGHAEHKAEQMEDR